MEKDIKNKVIVITGGADGIGYHMADNFLGNGAKTVVILDINDKLGNEAATSLNNKHGDKKATYIKCDVTKDLEVVSSKVFKNYKVDVLVNNAGICNEQAIRKTIELNVTAVLEWGLKFFEYMRKDIGGRGGTIFNVSSIYGYDYDPWMSVYKTSKHGVIGFTKTLGHPKNYEKFGVRVISICPGFTKTALVDAYILSEFEEEDFKEFAKTGCFQTVETVGKAAIEIFTVAESSTSWEIRDNKPIKKSQNPLSMCLFLLATFHVVLISKYVRQ